METASEFLALVRAATADSLERAAQLLPACAGALSPRERRRARRMLEHAASSFRHALEASEPPAAYDAHGGRVAAGEAPRLAVEG